MPNNHLGDQTSPYLRQHADNPVEWYPWGPEALERARRENRPILLSIGYSACHWCHVMAHESFEDPQTAALMNELFVNIKVDREERPDLDRIYQRAHQLLTRRPGGWPLTVFLDPQNHLPFFAGTYFPPEPRHGMPAFADVLRGVADFHRRHPDDLRRQNSELQQALASLQPTGRGTPQAAALDIARRQLEQSMDWRHGGFGQPPKFPHPGNLEFLLRHWALGGKRDQRALDMALQTLQQMGDGGIFDQIGGGFCRYSVDEQWMIPHFEKMLYDNGPLLALFAQAWQITGNDRFREVAEHTAAWVMREMQTPEGGYCSSLDADSEGEEGRFYCWTREQVKAALDDDEYAVFALRYGLDRPANFEGKWYPHGFTDMHEVCQQLALAPSQAARLLESACGKLFELREQRVRPGRDDKILTAWNALMIRGMAIAGRILRRDDWIASARRALDYLHERHWRGERLLATSQHGKAHLAAYLDDHVFLIDAILELAQCGWRDGELAFARQLADTVLDHFIDHEHGGFFFTADDHERLIERPKPTGDDSLPSGNGVAALALLRLGRLLGETRYTDAASDTLAALWPSIEGLPYAHTSLLIALQEWLSPPTIVILRGPSAALAEWQRVCQRDYAPQQLCFPVPDDASDPPGLLGEHAPVGEPRAWVCDASGCRPPVDDIDTLRGMLD